MSNSPPSSLFRRHRLSQAAADGMLILCVCWICRHKEAFVAADLIVVYGDMAVEDFAGNCGKCGRGGCVQARAYFPKPDDVGRINLIRPDGWKKTWNWRTEWLDLPIRPVDENGKMLPSPKRPGMWGDDPS